MVALCTLAAMALPGCSGPPEDGLAQPPASRTPVAVSSATGQPYTFADGAQARKQADAQCGTGGVRTSIYDGFEGGTWVYPEGCA